MSDPYRTAGEVPDVDVDPIEQIGRVAIRIVQCGGKPPKDAYMHVDDFRSMLERLEAKVANGPIGPHCDYVNLMTAVGTVRVSVDEDIKPGRVHVGERRR